jgi:predicted alternative tryptophan synthase beta-subunit
MSFRVIFSLTKFRFDILRDEINNQKFLQIHKEIDTYLKSDNRPALVYCSKDLTNYIKKEISAYILNISIIDDEDQKKS